MKVFIGAEKGIKLVYFLMKLPFFFDYSGDCSCQAVIKIPFLNKMLRFGVTDNDVSDFNGLWINFYSGLQIK